MEIAGDVARVLGEPMRRAIGCRVDDGSFEVAEPPSERDLRGMAEKRYVRCGTSAIEQSAFARLCGLAQYRRYPRVTVLHVEHRVLLRVFDRKREIEHEMRLRRALDEEEARGVETDLIHDLSERHGIPRALAHRHGLRA